VFVCVCVYVCGVGTHNFDSNRPSAGEGCVVLFAIINGRSTLSIWLARLRSLFLIPPSLYLSLDRSLLLSCSLCLALSLFRSLAPSLACLRSLSHARAPSLFFSLSFSRSLTHSLSYTHTHTHADTHTRTAQKQRICSFICVYIESMNIVYAYTRPTSAGWRARSIWKRSSEGVQASPAYTAACTNVSLSKHQQHARPHAHHTLPLRTCVHESKLAYPHLLQALYASLFSLLALLSHTLSARVRYCGRASVRTREPRVSVAHHVCTSPLRYGYGDSSFSAHDKFARFPRTKLRTEFSFFCVCYSFV